MASTSLFSRLTAFCKESNCSYELPRSRLTFKSKNTVTVEDGKIAVTYNHMEMPQTDENRAYYEMKYEILEDVSFKNFVKDFSFYSATSIAPRPKEMKSSRW